MMLLDARQPEKPSGILVDHGTGKRIFKPRRVDFSSGEYEAFAAAPNGKDILVGDDDRPVVVRGKSVGRLELVPIGSAHQFGVEKPKLTKSDVQPLSADQCLEGLEQYKKVYREVWCWRGESNRCVDDRWHQFLKTNDFLDSFMLRRRKPSETSTSSGVSTKCQPPTVLST